MCPSLATQPQSSKQRVNFWQLQILCAYWISAYANSEMNMKVGVEMEAETEIKISIFLEIGKLYPFFF